MANLSNPFPGNSGAAVNYLLHIHATAGQELAQMIPAVVHHAKKVHIKACNRVLYALFKHGSHGLQNI